MNDDTFTIQLSKFMIQRDKTLFLELTSQMNRIVILLSKDGSIVYLNEHASTFHGWEIASSVKRDNYSQLCQQSSIDASNLTNQIFQVPNGLMIEKKVVKIRKNGINAFLLINAISLDDDSILIIGQDITVSETKKALNRELANFLPSVLKHLRINVFWKDSNSVYMGGDEEFLRVCGLSRVEEIKGLTDFECPWNREQALKYINDDKIIYHTRQPQFNIVEETTFADKQIYPVIVSKFPLVSESNDLVGEIGIFAKLNEAARNKLAFFMANDILSDSIIPQNRRYYLPHPDDESESVYLSLREKQCLDEWVLGKTSKEIGRQLGISYRTVEIYINNLKEKLNIRSRSALMQFYLTYQGFWSGK